MYSFESILNIKGWNLVLSDFSLSDLNKKKSRVAAYTNGVPLSFITQKLLSNL